MATIPPAAPAGPSYGVFDDNTPAPISTPKKQWHFPSTGGTGQIPWAKGQTLADALAAAIPSITGMTAPADMTISLNMDVREN